MGKTPTSFAADETYVFLLGFLKFPQGSLLIWESKFCFYEK